MFRKLFRRKYVDRDESTTELKRVLTTFDLTLLGIGSTLGTGIYILAGQVAYSTAGPAVVLSFLVAAFASVLAGLCYAEFGARVPKAGSAYVYSYVCVGEVIAFIVGWNLIMEYIIGVASVAKAYSNTVDSIIPDHAMSQAFKDVGAINNSVLGDYFDFFAFGISAALTILLIIGVKESTVFNNVCTSLNLVVVVFAIVAGGIYSSTENWRIDSTAAPACKNVSNHPDWKPGDVGDGGFFPFGITGMLAGAATCFYGFVGFDVIATTGEEAKNPKKSIPLSIVISLFFIFLAYLGISTVMTMMLPYYCQDPNAPLPFAFEYNGFEAGKWIVNIGALFGLSTSLMGSMFPMPRIIYAMAQDGLLFSFLGKIHPKFQTPAWATLIGGLIGAFMGALFDLESLIEMMSIGTLTAYTIVALCVLILRYRLDATEEVQDSSSIQAKTSRPGLVSSLLNTTKAQTPTHASGRLASWVAVIYWVLCFAFCATLILGEGNEEENRDAYPPLAIAFLIIFGLLMLFCLVCLSRQAVSNTKLSFKVPLLPWMPALSILVNTYLIMKLSVPTWIRFGIWLAIGLVIYLYCLCSGRADRVYVDSFTQFQTTVRQAGKKISLTGIDNPALVFTDDEVGKPQTSHNPSEKETSPQNGEVGVLENGNGANGVSFKSTAVAEAKNLIVKIHETSQKALNGELIPMDQLVLAPKVDERKQRREATGDEVSEDSKTERGKSISSFMPMPSVAKDLADKMTRETESLHEEIEKAMNYGTNTVKNFLQHDTAKENSLTNDSLLRRKEDFLKDIKTGVKEIVDDAVAFKTNATGKASSVMERIHETSQKALNGDLVPVDQLILAPKVDERKQREASGEDVSRGSQSQVMSVSSIVPTPSIAKDLGDKMARETESLHEEIEKAMNYGKNQVSSSLDGMQENSLLDDTMRTIAAKVDSANETKVEAKVIVDDVVALAEAKARMLDEQYSQKAQQLVEEAFNSVFQTAGNGHDDGETNAEADPLPPFVSKISEISPYKKLQLESTKDDSDKVLVLANPLEIQDPIQHIHDVCQATVNGVDTKLGLLLASKEEAEDGHTVKIPVTPDPIRDEGSTKTFEMPELPKGFVSKVLILHEEAKELLKPEDLMEEIHNIYQKAIEDVTDTVENLPILVSPARREEAQEAIQAYINDPKNQEEAPDNMAAATDTGFSLQEDFSREIERLHEEASAEFPVPDDMATIHEICKRVIEDIEDAVQSHPALLSTRSERVEAQEVLRKAVTFAQESEAAAGDDKEEDEGDKLDVGQNAEAVALMMIAHAKAREEFGAETEKEKEEIVGNDRLSKIHDIAQLSLNGVPADSVPWLEPVLASEKEKQEIRDLTTSLTESGANKRMSEPDPLPPHIARKVEEDIERAHRLAQMAMREVRESDQGPEVAFNDDSEVDPVERIHKIAQLALDGVRVESTPWLDPVLSSTEEKESIRRLTQRLTEEAKEAESSEREVPSETTSGSEDSPVFDPQTLEIHRKAQEVLNPLEYEAEVEDKQPNVGSSYENDLERIHQIAQLSLNGVPAETVAWLKPVLNSEEDHKEILEVTKRLQEAAMDVEQGTPVSPSQLTTTTSIPEEILEIHEAAQEKLNERYVTAPQTPSEEISTPIMEQIQQVAQLAMMKAEKEPSSTTEERSASPEATTEKEVPSERLQKKHVSTVEDLETVKDSPGVFSPIKDTSFADRLTGIHESAKKALEPVEKELDTMARTFADKFPQFNKYEDKTEADFVTVGSVLSAPESLEGPASPEERIEDGAKVPSSEGKKKRFRIEQKVVLSPSSESPFVKFKDTMLSQEPVETLIAKHTDKESIRRKIMNRRPTGPALPQLKKFYAKLSADATEGNSEEEEEEDENNELEDKEVQDDEVASSSSNQSFEEEQEKAGENEPQPAVPRRQSSSNQQTKNMRDLISLFERGKSS